MQYSWGYKHVILQALPNLFCGSSNQGKSGIPTKSAQLKEGGLISIFGIISYVLKWIVTDDRIATEDGNIQNIKQRSLKAADYVQ